MVQFTAFLLQLPITHLQIEYKYFLKCVKGSCVNNHNYALFLYFNIAGKEFNINEILTELFKSQSSDLETTAGC